MSDDNGDGDAAHDDAAEEWRADDADRRAAGEQ